jgi:hypothetical protein
MNKNVKILLAMSVVAVVLLSFCVANKKNGDVAKDKQPVLQSSSSQDVQKAAPADKIEVVHFHGTNQCVSCISVGKFALETIKTKFPEEYESRKIIFKDINGDLSENQEIVQKYQARGSSLFVNAIRTEKEDIKEDTTVWRLVGDENKYITYFEGKLKTLLGE